jgi:AraC-like DNA-binding protein
MATGAGSPGLTLFSTAGIAEGERFNAWRGLLDSIFPAGINIRQAADEPFFASVRIRQLAETTVAWGPTGGAATQMQKQANDDFKLVVSLDGPVLASQRGKDARLEAGDAYLLTHAEYHTIDRPMGGSVLTARVRRDAIAAFLKHPEDQIGRFIPRENEGVRLLSQYVKLIGELEPLVSPPALSLVTAHVHDLMILALGAEGDSREHASNRGLRAAQFKAIKAHVEQRLSDGNLSPEALAPLFGASARSIQRMFEREGTTFTDYLRERRLLFAKRMLASPRFGRKRVIEIALLAGFGDISHFNRDFRRHFGQTPTEARKGRKT